MNENMNLHEHLPNNDCFEVVTPSMQEDLMAEFVVMEDENFLMQEPCDIIFFPIEEEVNFDLLESSLQLESASYSAPAPSGMDNSTSVCRDAAEQAAATQQQPATTLMQDIAGFTLRCNGATKNWTGGSTCPVS